MPAKAAEDECGAASEILGNVDASSKSNVRTTPGAFSRAESQFRSRLDAKRLKVGCERSIDCGRHICACNGDDSCGAESQRRSQHRALQACCGFRIADESVGEPESQRVHRS